MLELTIDSRKVTANPGTSILEAAMSHGIFIPNLCYDKRLKPYGGCRLCIVEVQGQRKLITACSTPVKDGMVVSTDTPRVAKIRKTLLELILLHHPLDCPVCDKAGECTLQDLAFRYGALESRFSTVRKHEPARSRETLISRSMSRCILCGKCVNLCHQYQGTQAINFIGRGFKTKVSPAFEESLDCEFCGQCIDICPVGALGSATYRSKSRSWYEEEHPTICPYCGCGCTTNLFVRENRILRARGKAGQGVNKGDLCAKGRFGFDFLYGENRLTTPLIRKEGRQVPAGWDEALALIAKRLDIIKQEHGSSAIGAIGSQRCTIEDNYMLQRFMREVIGSDNIDSGARFGYAITHDAVRRVLGRDYHPIRWDVQPETDFIFVLESDITSSLPVWGLKFIKAKHEGAKLVVADALDTKLARNSTSWLQIRPGSSEALLKCLILLLSEDQSVRKVAEAIPNLDALLGSIERYTVAYTSLVTGLTEREITDLATDYRQARKRLLAMTIGTSENRKGLNSLLLAANLVLLMGDDPATLQVPAELCNTLGMWLAGVRPLSDGKDVRSMLYKTGGIKAFYIMGENPLITFKQSEAVELRLRSCDFLVVQDINLTETAKLANVVLPACSWGEKEGTFMNATGTLQQMPRLLPTAGQSLPDWQILRDLSGVMNSEIGSLDVKQIRKEIYELATSWANAETNLPAFHPVPDSPHELPDEIYPLVLITSDLFQHSGTLSAESRNLGSVVSDAYLKINPADAERYHITDDDYVHMSSRRGEVYIKANVTVDVMEGTVVAPVHFQHVRIHNITHLAFDGEAPVDAVKVEPA
ncbi:MAG: molybdopterin-dependent oxidoreductase [Dissulfurispiraceae bacterium]